MEKLAETLPLDTLAALLPQTVLMEKLRSLAETLDTLAALLPEVLAAAPEEQMQDNTWHERTGGLALAAPTKCYC